MSDALSDIARGRYFAGEPDDDCPECNGTGQEIESSCWFRVCETCKGTGKKVRK